MFLPLLMGIHWLVLVVLYITECLFQFWNYLDEEERAGCFTWIGLQCVIVVFSGHTHFFITGLMSKLRNALVVPRVDPAKRQSVLFKKII